jgi:lipoprotein-anchoring transpeptidase ErfK/SrfK
MRRRGLLLLALLAGAGGVAEPAAARKSLVGGPTARSAWTARVVAPTTARTEPWTARGALRLSTRAKWGGGPMQLLVLDSMYLTSGRKRVRRMWVQVALPERPNGRTGWIRADKVMLRRTRWRVVISRGSRTATVYRAGRVARRMQVVVGAPETPTPLGLFAVYEPIRQADPNGFIGPWALHLTAFSNVLENFGGGPGRVAMHGRSGASLADPLGTARSHGCIRMLNEDITYLAARLVPGTPVRIVA